jgi:hypothetical protein
MKLIIAIALCMLPSLAQARFESGELNTFHGSRRELISETRMMHYLYACGGLVGDDFIIQAQNNIVAYGKKMGYPININSSVYEGILDDMQYAEQEADMIARSSCEYWDKHTSLKNEIQTHMHDSLHNGINDGVSLLVDGVPDYSKSTDEMKVDNSDPLSRNIN